MDADDFFVISVRVRVRRRPYGNKPVSPFRSSQHIRPHPPCPPSSAIIRRHPPSAMADPPRPPSSAIRHGGSATSAIIRHPPWRIRHVRHHPPPSAIIRHQCVFFADFICRAQRHALTSSFSSVEVADIMCCLFGISCFLLIVHVHVSIILLLRPCLCICMYVCVYVCISPIAFAVCP